MTRASDLSRAWGWLPLDDNCEWDSIFTIHECFDNEYHNVIFAIISVLYIIINKIHFIFLMAITILLGHWHAVSLVELILSVITLSLLVIIPRVFRYGYENHQEVVRPFFSTMWKIWFFLSLPSIFTYFPMVWFRACQAIEIVRKYLVSIRDELYNITGLEFQYPDLPDGDVTHLQPRDTRAERWMRLLVQEDRSRRKARQDEQDRIAEAENRRQIIENERIEFAWTGLQSRGPPTRQRLRERSGLSLIATPRPREVTLAGSFRASDPVSPSPAREPAPAATPAPAPADTGTVQSGQEIRRDWVEGRLRNRRPGRILVKDSSTQTDPTDIANHGMMTEPTELHPQPYVSRGVQTDLVEPPSHEEPEAPVVVPDLPVSEPSPDPASPEDTQRSPDKGKSRDGPEPTINSHLVFIYERKAEDEVKEPECSTVSSPIPASIPLHDSPKPATDAEPRHVQTHATVHAPPNTIESVPRTSAPAILKSTRQAPVHPTASAPEASRRIGRGPKSSIRRLQPKENNGIRRQTRKDVPSRNIRQANRHQIKREKMYDIFMGSLEEQSPSPIKPLETQQVIDTTTTEACENVSEETSVLEKIIDIDAMLDASIATSPVHGCNESEESEEDIYGDSLDGNDDKENQQENLVGVPETPAERTGPDHRDEEMGSFEPGAAEDAGVSTKEEQVPIASPTDDAQMVDVWRPNEEESQRIGDAAPDVFRDLMDQDDEDSSEDTKPKREPSMSPMRWIVTEDQQGSIEDTPMQDVQSSAPPGITAGLHLPIQQPEDPSVQAQPFTSPESPPVYQAMPQEEQDDLAKMMEAEFSKDGPDTPTQDAQPLSAHPQPLTSGDPHLEAFRARVKAAETKPQPDKYYGLQVPRDLDPPDPVKEATAEQRAKRKIAKPISRTHKCTSTAQTTPQSVSQGQPYTQSETLRQTPAQVTADEGGDIAEMDSPARNLLLLASDMGIVVGNDASDQESSHQDTNAQETDSQSANNQETNTQEANMQESAVSDTEVERQTATTQPEEQTAPNSQKPQSTPAPILSAESQPSPAAAAQQHTPTTNNSPTVAGPSSTQQQPSIRPMMMGGLMLPGGNPTLCNPTATATPAPGKSGPDPEKIAEFHRKKQAQLKKPRPKKPVGLFIQKKRPAAVPSTPNTPRGNPNSSTQGQSPSLGAIDEGDENRQKTDRELTFGIPGSNKKKQGLQIIDINDVPDHQRNRMQKDDAGRKDEEEEES
ncbi:uncharacterized protein BKA55DRAFT_548679 [Fusarium redolens]|uniref:Uncharacterized protein n=1 Tax=Fusarium redolens TaxID=48865 RepID=A0A9P9KVS2_FUSRE|nr:uncharacterized protein BKA55DRAFT_548679 [Fusarium redolens]KAH7269473.1 hypothetical protein BKA55DRAFT_548679 [Fusarium redolens]